MLAYLFTFAHMTHVFKYRTGERGARVHKKAEENKTKKRKRKHMKQLIQCPIYVLCLYLLHRKLSHPKNVFTYNYIGMKVLRT